MGVCQWIGLACGCTEVTEWSGAHVAYRFGDDAVFGCVGASDCGLVKLRGGYGGREIEER